MISHNSFWIDARALEFFIKKVVILKVIKLILLIIKLDSKGLERSIGDMDAKKIHYLIF
jgi:hypothetical protein